MTIGRPKVGRSEGIRRGPAALTLALSLALLVALAQPTPAQAQRGLEIGFLEDRYAAADGSRWLGETKNLGGDFARVNLRWSGIVSVEPASPADPADPAYDFTVADRVVRGANQQGLQVLLTVYGAPAYAEGPNRPPATERAPAGSWKPSPDAINQFARAVGKRYSGSFDPGDGGGRLPRVEYMSAWNEPNILVYNSPQWQGGQPVGAQHYRRMHNAFYDGVKAESPRVQVLTGATAPFGDPPSQQRRARPLTFWREVLCLRPNLKPKGNCPQGERLRFDSLAHHPIHNPNSPQPRKSPGNEDDLQIGNFGKLRQVLRAAERHKTTGTRGRHDVWAPEIWWQSKPRPEGQSPRRQAQFMSEALYLLWKQGAAGVSFLQLVDSPLDRSQSWAFNYQTGVFTANGKRKPSYGAVKFPFVADRRNRQRVFVWGKAPRSGQIVIQRQQGRSWRRVARTRAGASRVFTTRLRLRGAQNLRAVVRKQASRPWKVGRR